MDFIAWTVLAISALASLYCAFKMWRDSTGSVVKKIAWTLLLPIPIFGPLLHAGMYELPTKQDPLNRARESEFERIGYKSDDDFS